MVHDYEGFPRHEHFAARWSLSAALGGDQHQAPQPPPDHTTWIPAVDITETGERYEFTVELPGMEPEAMAIEVKDNTLTIQGERTARPRTAGERCHYRERPTGRFARVFRMAKPIDTQGVTATYRDGLLSVIVPVRAEARPRTIPVQGEEGRQADEACLLPVC